MDLRRSSVADHSWRSAREIVFVERLYAARAAEGGEPPFGYLENTTLRAKLADVDRLDVKTVPFETSFAAVVSWRPWLEDG